MLARRVQRGETETQWFIRHRSTPITEIPEDWPKEYCDVVAKRIEAIEHRSDIGLIERPEYKRRWQSEPWEQMEREALKDWLLDRCEQRSLWYGPDRRPQTMTVNRLSDRLHADSDSSPWHGCLLGRTRNWRTLSEIIADEHVPYLAQLRYRDSGLLKRGGWERTWDLQREEDRTGKRLDIPVPPDLHQRRLRQEFLLGQRGKLDMPKERFISYPLASLDSDDSLLIGWAGWDHREQAQALITLIEERSAAGRWDASRLRHCWQGWLRSCRGSASGNPRSTTASVSARRRRTRRTWPPSGRSTASRRRT